MKGAGKMLRTNGNCMMAEMCMGMGMRMMMRVRKSSLAA